MKKITTVSFLVIIAFLVLNSCNNQNSKKVSEKTITISTNLPLTGNLGVYGKDIQKGVQFALDEISMKKDSVKLDFNWNDNKGEAKMAANIYQKTNTKKQDVYVSGVKPQTMAIINQVSNDKIPHFVWVFDAFICKNYQNTYRTWVNFKIEPEYYMKYIQRKNPQKIAIIYPNLPHTNEEYEEILIPNLINELNIKKSNILAEKYEYTKNDFKNIASKIKDFSADLIVASGFTSSLIGITKSLREFNLIENGNTIATYDMMDAASSMSNDMTEDIRVVAPKFSFDIAENKNIKKWKEEFETKYGQKPKYTSAYAFDMTKIIYNAALRLEHPASHHEWKDALLNSKINGITGSSEFNKYGDLNIDLKIGVFKNGKLIPDKDFNN